MTRTEPNWIGSVQFAPWTELNHGSRLVWFSGSVRFGRSVHNFISEIQIEFILMIYRSAESKPLFYKLKVFFFFTLSRNLDERTKPNDQNLNERTNVSSVRLFSFFLLPGNVINIPFFLFFRKTGRTDEAVLLEPKRTNKSKFVSLFSVFFTSRERN